MNIIKEEIISTREYEKRESRLKRFMESFTKEFNTNSKKYKIEPLYGFPIFGRRETVTLYVGLINHINSRSIPCVVNEVRTFIKNNTLEDIISINECYMLGRDVIVLPITNNVAKELLN